MNFSKNLLVSVVISVLLLGLVLLMRNLDQKYQTLSEDLELTLDAQAHISYVIKELGYTGFIHNYKNYLLRGEDVYYRATENNFKRLARLLDEDKLTRAHPQLLSLLEQIQLTLNEYEVNLERIRQLHHQGLSVTEIDNQVRVDDRAAGETLVKLMSQFQLGAAQLLSQINDDQQLVRSRLQTVAIITLVLAFAAMLAGWVLVSRYWMDRRLGQQLAFRQKLLHASPIPILILDDSGIIVLANDGSEQLFKMSSDQLVGRNINAFVPAEPPLHQQAQPQSAASSEHFIRNPFTLKNAAGEVRDVEVVLARYVLDQVPFIAASLNDVTNGVRQHYRSDPAEENFQATFDMAPIGMAQVSVNGHFLRVNRKLAEMLGYSRQELEGMHIVDVTFKEDVGISKYVMDRFENNDTEYFHMEKRYQHKNGDVIWANLTTRLHRDNFGIPQYLISIVEDISQRKRYENDLLESEAKFKTIVNHVNGVVWMATPGLEKVLFVSEHFEQLWGQSADTLKTNPLAFINAIVEEDKPRVIEAINQHRHGRWDVEYRMRAADGDIHFIHDEGAAVRNQDGEIVFIVGLARDVTSEKTALKKLEEANRKLEQLAKFDPLTMAVRRQYALADFEECIALHRRYGSDATLIFVDMHDFKSVNDRFGHEGGDQVLIEFARYIRSNIRETDGFYRFAGDEFLILLRETDAGRAQQFVDKLQAHLPQVTLDQGGQVDMSFDCGFCSLQGRNINEPTEWIRLADERMYQVKNQRKS